MIRIGIFGATGYVGLSLMTLLKNHKEAEVVFGHSNNYAGKMYKEIFRGCNSELILSTFDQCIDKLKDVDVVFLALPHGISFKVVEEAMKYNVKVIEMGGDYRLDDPLEYEKWYGVKHTSLEYLKEAVYGLPEINKDKIKGARVLANPGCYATASSLGLLPIINAGLCDTKTIVVDGKSGTSGAGRGGAVDNIFSEINENFKAYKVGCHRHTPEIEQVLNTKSKSEVKLTFVPQLVPMTRGILITAYVDLTSDIKEEEIFDLYKEFYKDAKFVEVVEDVPQTKWSKNTNMAYISVRKDSRTNKLIIISAIDNLVKGAAGQGIQNMNIMFGLPEETGLDDLAVLP